MDQKLQRQKRVPQTVSRAKNEDEKGENIMNKKILVALYDIIGQDFVAINMENNEATATRNFLNFIKKSTKENVEHLGDFRLMKMADFTWDNEKKDWEINVNKQVLITENEMSAAVNQKFAEEEKK
jgi:hypothetical protein